MIDPRAYTIQLPDYANSAFGGLVQGMQIGAYDNQLQAQKVKAEQDAIQKQQMQDDLAAYINNTDKTAEDTTNLMVKYPSLSDNLSKAFSVMDSSKKDNLFKTSAEVLSSIRGGRPDVARQILEEQKNAHLNAGRPDDAGRVDALIKQIDFSPESVASNAELTMAAIDPTKFADTYKALREQGRSDQMQPYEIAQQQAQTGLTQAQTEKAQTENQYLPSEKEANISNIESQIEDRSVNQALEREKLRLNNDQFYQKLDQDSQQFYEKLNQDERNKAKAMMASKVENDEKRMARLEKAQSFSTTAVNASDTAKLAAELINDYKKLSDASGAGVWNAAMRNIPGTAEYDFARRVETLKSQAFMIGAQNLKGLGAMTEMEGKKVTDALGNLDLSQETAQVAKQLAAIAKASNNVAQSANKNAQLYATKGRGYSAEVIEAARQRGISPAEMQKIANNLGY
jgi:hypothetical protein